MKIFVLMDNNIGDRLLQRRPDKFDTLADSSRPLAGLILRAAYEPRVKDDTGVSSLFIFQSIRANSLTKSDDTLERGTHESTDYNSASMSTAITEIISLTISNTFYCVGKRID